MEQKITGYTDLYGIVATPIKHSLSPLMHNTAFQAMGIDAVYMAFEIDNDQLSHYITSVKTLKMKGFNVSMPYKSEILAYLDELTEEAQLCQAVNTVKNEQGRLIGHNSDGEGFVRACQQKGWDLRDKKIVVLGAGGASRAIIVALAQQGIKEIIVYNRSQKAFVQELQECLKCQITFKLFIERDALRKDLKDAYLCVQTTSVGMHAEDCLLVEDDLVPSLKIADIIYHPAQTKLLKMAESLGMDYMNGEGMIVNQGAVSFAFWTGQEMPITLVKKALGMEK